MEKTLSGKIALVTGGARGIGRAISELLAENGAYIVVNDITTAEVSKADELLGAIRSKGGDGEYLQFDVSKPDETANAIDGIVSKHNKIDILVNNAGITRDNLLIRMKEEEWEQVISVNLKGTFNCCKAAAKYMMKQRGGKIVSIASVVGEMGNAGQVNYSASKAGIIGITKSLAKELASRNITVNAIAPGFIETVMTENLPQNVKDEMKRNIPLGYFGKPVDIAETVLFLVSGKSSYITGQVLRVNGGMYM